MVGKGVEAHVAAVGGGGPCSAAVGGVSRYAV